MCGSIFIDTKPLYRYFYTHSSPESFLLNNTIKPQHENDRYYFKYAVVIAAIAGLTAQVLSHSYNYAYAYRDAIYRMEAARRFFDSLTPGIINQIGTVWLPVPNLILMPFAMIDFLWETGLGAGIINLPAYIISCGVIFLIIKRITQNKAAAWFGFLIFTFNYNILYFQTTAMTEQLYMTFMICSFYYLLVWQNEKKGNEKKEEQLLYSSIFLSLAMGTRYDAWPVALVCAVWLFIFCLTEKNKPLRNTIIFSLLPAAAVTGWIIYNWIRYGDPFEFSRGPLSTLYQLKYYEERGRLLTKNDFLLSAKVYFSSLFLYSGIIYSILSFIGLILYTIYKRLRVKSLLPYILWIALPVTLFLLYKGQLIIELPDSQPPGYFNSRYGLYVFSGIAVFCGITASYLTKISRGKLVIGLLACVFLIQQSVLFIKFPENIPAIAEAEYAYSKASEDLSFFLKQNYKGGRILYDNAIFALHPWAGIDLRDRITYHTFVVSTPARITPSKYVQWVLIYKDAPNDKIHESVRNNPDFLNNFELKFSENGVEAYKKK